ncbi:hypothetical protein BEWA_020500 [Theileria equi strain WA]|uniref:Methylosome subunit pICln n=1 Tax=Theileria equi strain WA TaxID=1537102 RepID=L0AVC9_THEEQ|nr:hypothetical protein BEWA_020500 [Theileria equi strain WA]AFZ79203.1 hypothetical protein BEWA_020500 [Theileria equi strain WA]|eukprot:XP_004828869.1 hypothetical protein BEWA_020500 [Theileria equi strain WA]
MIGTGAFQKGVETDSANQPILYTSNNEHIHHKYEQIRLIFGQEDGVGTLYITTSRIIWISTEDSSFSYGFTYQGIVLHAISKDTNLHDKPCVFIQLDGDSSDEGDIPTVMLVPHDPVELEEIFNDISTMSSLHDVVPSDSEDDSDAHYEGDEEAE